jgi:hypothetical protein
MTENQRQLVFGFSSIGATAASIARVLDLEVDEVRKVLSDRVRRVKKVEKLEKVQ